MSHNAVQSGRGWRRALFHLGAAAIVALAVIFATRGIADEPQPPQKAPNPHWNAESCAACHAMSAGKPAPIAPEQIDGVCLKCHDGARATAEVHPIARDFSSNQYNHPAGWPAPQSRLACITCHDMKRACSANASRTEDDRFLLRPTTVTAEGLTFCNNCHKPEHSAKFNPHIMLDDHAQPIQDRCVVCHTANPGRDVAQRSGKSLLRADVKLECRSCHPRHKNISIEDHLGKKLKPEMLAFMRAREVVGLLNAPSDDLLKQLKASGEKPTRMLPARDGAIDCATCHNVHQQGLFPASSPLGYRAMKLVEHRTVSPVHSEQWCQHCHAF